MAHGFRSVYGRLSPLTAPTSLIGKVGKGVEGGRSLCYSPIAHRADSGNNSPAGAQRTARGRCRRSEFNLLRQCQGIIDLDAEVADRALDFRISEKKLDRSQIARLPIDLRRLGAAH